MGCKLGARQSRSQDAENELHELRREVLELRIQNIRLLNIIQDHGTHLGWHGSYIHEPTGVRVFVSTEGKGH